MTDREPVPIACSSTPTGLADRVEEWRALVAASVVSVATEPDRRAPGAGGSEPALVSAASLAQREKECCPFFDVHIDIEADRRTLVLSRARGRRGGPGHRSWPCSEGEGRGRVQGRCRGRDDRRRRP